MRSLPKKIRTFLKKNYQHYWGSIYLYAPQLDANERKFTLKFSGRYQLQNNGETINLNGAFLKTNTITFLPKGDYVSYAKDMYRLKLIPKENTLLLTRFQKDNWEKIIF